jgi:hypothetical protein
LAAAGALVLLLPGACLLRAVGWPARLATGIACSFVLSLAVCFVALALSFAAGGSLSLTVVALIAMTAGALLPAIRTAPVSVGRDELVALAALVALGVAIGGVAWWVSTTASGAELFHIARVRRLDELAPLSIHTTDELRGGGVHPGYVFPLWHGALALIARLGGVDPAVVVVHLGTVLCPLALAVSYATGTELFGSRAGGLATALAQTAVFVFPRDGLGLFRDLALPQNAALLLLVPAILACIFAAVDSGSLTLLACAALGGLVLAAVRLSDVALLAIPLAGFGAFRLLRRDGRRDALRIGTCLGAFLAPAGLFLVWALPYVRRADAFLPTAGGNTAAAALRPGQVAVHGSLFAITPEAIAAGGAGVVAGLLALVVAVRSASSRWAAFVLGGSLAILVTALAPPLFRALSDLVTMPQALTLPALLPLPFALAGLALAAVRLGPAALVLAAALGAGLALAYGAGPGPGWAVWVAAAAGVLALGVVRRPRLGSSGHPGWLAAAVALAFVVPLAVVGLDGLRRDAPDPHALPAGLIEAVRSHVPAGETVFADVETSYRLAAAAPVLVVAEPPAYAAGTRAAHPAQRARDAAVFFSARSDHSTRAAWILADSGATWLVADTRRPVPGIVQGLAPPVYSGGGYSLYELG